MEIAVRAYLDSDYAEVRTLFGELSQHFAEIYGDQVISGADPGRGFDVYLKRTNRVGSWVAVKDKQVVGFTGLLDVIGEEGIAEIEPLIVSESYRSQGIGSKLAEYAKQEAKKKGFEFLTIKPTLRNEEAFHLYIRLGFNIIGSVELFQDLMPERGRTWKPGVTLLGHKLGY
jgi:ribosomal protein S18 acetylase RimI-like enzyme